MRQEITCVALEMTTVCDRACPDCCANINRGEREAHHHNWAYFMHAAKFIRGIHRIHLTGGEPTTHPYFAEYVPRFKALFGCTLLTLQTDCFKTEQYAETLKCFDHIYPSRYDARNAGAADLIRIKFPSTEFAGEHVSRSRRGSGAVCFRGESDTVAYADGLFHGCCVSPGIPGAATLEPCEDWREKILGVQLPCSDCFFSPGEDGTP